MLRSALGKPHCPPPPPELQRAHSLGTGSREVLRVGLDPELQAVTLQLLFPRE